MLRIHRLLLRTFTLGVQHTPQVTSATAPAAVAEQEFPFARADFNRVRQLIYAHAGISLHEGKQAMVYSRVARRLRATGHRSFTAYLNWLESAPQAPEWQEFINCLTTNLTAFFREDHHFPLLAQDLQAMSQSARRTLQIWCCAASTGEEPYSIAITALETLGSRQAAQILASDIDTRVLQKAESGIYSADSKGLSRERLKAFFLRGTGPNQGLMRVKPELRSMIAFRPHNLMAPVWDLGAPMDIVFCRNVMIYFDAATQREVLARIHAAMRPGGMLYVGHSENFNDARRLFRLRGKTVYERLP